ncbi:hypothetical protein V5O48_015643 [Marasmius crinis-equi]|uniref:Uncharacterized protein n=1 Tax=Marasmius crinis-equi TaxID=585013 RepID=A0ABR3ETZ1_9AGAR
MQMEKGAHMLRLSVLEQELKEHATETQKVRSRLQDVVENRVTRAYLDDVILRVETLLIARQATVIDWINARLGSKDSG